MVALTALVTQALPLPRLRAIYVAVASATALAVIALAADQVVNTAGIPAFWLMGGLALLAANLAFVTVDPRGQAMVLCPVLTFTFAILLCWGLGPAIVVQGLSTLLVGLRLRAGFAHIAKVVTWYVLSMTAAYTVLMIGNPAPFAVTTVPGRLADMASIAVAAAAWLAVYFAQALIDIRLSTGTIRWVRVRRWLAPQIFFLGALLLLSPVLAIAAHVNPAFVLLIILPIYAVQRMARLSAEKERAAWSDPLTGLANRRGLQGSYADLTASPPADGSQLGLLMLDLDRFKVVNDALGHEVGDRLLVVVGERLMQQTPPGGAVGRLGGDEFAILIPHLRDADQAQRIATGIIAALARPVRLDELDIDITASAGIAMQPYREADFTTLLRHADVALYDAKQNGDTASAYNPGTDLNSPKRLTLLTDLRAALTEPAGLQLEMHYQPQTAVGTGHLVGVEALLRWTHPTRGAVPPTELLQVAEHTSVMHLLTMRVIEQVTAQMAAWRRAGISPRTSLNISARDLYSGDIVTHLAECLAYHGILPGQLQIEITESALMTDPTRAHHTITRISSMGVAVALDDFGTGYSSLQHLRRLPLSEIKIDRSFVAGMTHNPDDNTIVRSTIDLANALGLRIVAEGVEDGPTWLALAEAGCSLAQGWYVAHPMPGDQLPMWQAVRTADPVRIGAGSGPVKAASRSLRPTAPQPR